MDIPTALTSLSTAVEIARTVADIKKGFDEAEYKLKIAQLMTTLAETQVGLISVQKEMSSKDDEITRLRSAFAFKGQTVKRGGFSFEALNGEPALGFAFCPRCEAIDNRYVQLFRSMRRTGGNCAACPQCKTEYDLHEAYWNRAAV